MQNGDGAAVATENLTKKFGSRRAVDGVTVSIARGEVLAVFGPNGAGKTTLLRMLGGILRPTSGSARIGEVPLPGGSAVRRRIGIVSHQTLLYDALTARENVEFAARLYGVTNFREKTVAALEAMKIADRADAPVRSLSRGMKQRVSVARAIVHDPEVVLADEPFNGLDVAGAAALSSLLSSLKSRGAALLLVTHNVDEGLALASRAAIMANGKLVSVAERSAVDPARFSREYQELVMRADAT